MDDSDDVSQNLLFQEKANHERMPSLALLEKLAAYRLSVDQNFSEFLQNERDRFVDTLPRFTHLSVERLIQFSRE